MFNHAANDAKWEKRLRIRTAAAQYEKKDDHHSPYEPTSYAVLERLAMSGWITGGDTVVDYGCGKGRVGFYLNHALGCRTIGVEYDAHLHAAALENLRSYSGRSAASVSFVQASAESYEIEDANCFYFFNPFSEHILRAVLGRIRESWYANPRELKLFFYYTQDAYLSCLMEQDDLEAAGEIDCRALYDSGNPREKILVYKINPAV